MKYASGMVFCALTLTGAWAHARTLSVPGEHASLAEAVAVASPGDTIEVAGGRHCGVRVDRQLTLVGRDGATIMGCPESPTVHGLRVGLLLLGSPGGGPGSGTQVSGFTFDGAGISTERTTPLAFGVFGRFTSDVIVSGNVFLGTVQPVTNTAGDRWVVTGNRMRALTAFANGPRMGGGIGVVIGAAAGDLAAPGGSLNPLNRPEDNTVADNEIDGRIPDGLDGFSMAAILVEAADRTVVSRNRLHLPRNQRARAEGTGVLLTVTSGGREQPVVPGARGTVVEENDGRESERVLLVEHRGVPSSEGHELRGNVGRVEIERP